MRMACNNRVRSLLTVMNRNSEARNAPDEEEVGHLTTPWDHGPVGDQFVAPQHEHSQTNNYDVDPRFGQDVLPVLLAYAGYHESPFSSLWV